MVLTELREIYGISMQDLADSIHVSKQLIGQIEKGKRDITEDILTRLMEYFGLEDVTDIYKPFLIKDSMDSIEILKARRSKIKKEIRENPEIIGFDPQLSLFGEVPIYRGESEIYEFDKKIEDAFHERINQIFMQLHQDSRLDVIIELTEKLDKYDIQEMILKLLKHFDDEESLEELKETVNEMEID